MSERENSDIFHEGAETRSGGEVLAGMFFGLIPSGKAISGLLDNTVAHANDE